jgi:hypothetical protein
MGDRDARLRHMLVEVIPRLGERRRRRRASRPALERVVPVMPQPWNTIPKSCKLYG